MKNRHCPSSAFTLIELLVVIAVVAILATLIIAGIGHAREMALSGVSRSNLRQVGVAISSYNMENGHIPPGSEGNWVFWYRLVSPYLGTETNSNNILSPLLDSPLKAIPTEDVRSAFIGNANLMPDLANTSQVDRKAIRMDDVLRPSQVILLIDGEQNPSTGRVGHINYQMPGLSDRNPDHGNDSIGVLDNEDRGRASVRFRHRGERFAQCLFVDGHVEDIENGKLLKKYFQISY